MSTQFRLRARRVHRQAALSRGVLIRQYSALCLILAPAVLALILIMTATTK